MKNLSIETLTYILISMFGLSLGNQVWNSYKMSNLQSTIKEQLDGKLSANARLITEANEELRLARSEMLQMKELQEKAEENLERFGNDFENFKSRTGAQVDSLGVQISRLGIDLKKGSATRGAKKPSKPVDPPPASWSGFKIEHISWCEMNPDSCDPFFFTWESDHQVKGSPIATFSTPNLWGEDFKLSLNLAFRVTAVNFRENPTEGAVQNQSIRVEAGFFDEKTQKFVVLTETELFEGDPNLSPEFFYTPTLPVQPMNKIRLFEPFLYLGVGYAPVIETSLVVAGSFLNLKNGEIRIGADALISSNNLGVGAQVSYHPNLFGKSLNIAPMGSFLLRNDGSYTWGTGLLFQVW